MWLCRAGQRGRYIDMCFKNNKMYLTWEGYNLDCRNYTDIQGFRDIVAKEKNIENKTTISNWSSQLYQFVNGISIGDYVLIPGEDSKVYHLSKVIGEYQYSCFDTFHHSREIQFIHKNILREIFNQQTQYSLRAYRTLYRIKNDEYVLRCIKDWSLSNRKRNKNG